MSVSILETIKSKANAGNTAYIVVLSLLCDTYSDLPTQYGLTGYELAQGCKAHVIDTNTDYMLDSVGTWHIYGGEIWQNVYTKTETDTLLDDKQDELTTAQLDAVNSGITAEKLTADEAALAEVVDGGAKNLSTVSSGIISNSGGGFPISSTPITVPIGTYIVSFKFSGNATRGSVQFRSGSTAIDSLSFNMAPLVSVQIEITSDTIDNFNLYSNSTATISEFMICTAADWDVSKKYVPYAPTNRELYEMIQALQ